jgi:hypothetical protein
MEDETGRPLTGAVFKDVASPHREMEKGDWRRVSFAKDTDDVHHVDLPIRSMYATQSYVNPDYKDVGKKNTEKPFVLKKNSKYFLQDGHHRVMAAHAAGKQTVPVRLVDLDNTTQTEFPLVDRMHKAEGGEVASDDQRQLSPVGLYSHAADVTQRFPQMKGTPQQFKAMLTKQGVKPDEFKYSNYDEKFAGKPMVTKDELAQHFKASVPPVQETTLGGDEIANNDREHDAITAEVRRREGPHFNDADPEHWDRAWQRHPDLAARNGRAQLGRAPTKFHSYTLPGGTNYRETLLHLPPRPQKASEAQLRARAKDFGYEWDALTPEDRAKLQKYEDNVPMDDAYKSSHWDTPNVLAHLRLSDRALPGGQKALHLEELQSDWAQEGRKKGFAGAATFTPEERAEYNRRLLQTPHDDQSRRRLMELAEKERQQKQGVPSAPYVDSTQKWVDLGLKRALHEAAKGGYHKLVMTPGEEQAKRYDISKHVDKVNLLPDPSGQHRIEAYKDNRKVIEQHAKDEHEVAAIVGKEVAEKLFKGRNQHGAATLAGQDLKIGGEGMKAFYDKMLPQALEKLAKKHDPEARVQLHHTPERTPTGKVEPQEGGLWRIKWDDGTFSGGYGAERDARAQVAHRAKGKKTPALHSLDITPKMRESILKGQPAYAAGGTVKPKAPRWEDLKPIAERWGYNSPHYTRAREAYDMAKGSGS